ncbi:hypothetical protein COCSADRAFT_35828 [Bipolaris sorokiniana ND90Pr]|uniref:BHLH domain-containing protein n=1 Tax=Cochliobolus sativus (strain ND90Pr / ATCC 201652) TaxID=665912 RepID=M2T9C2_COCSN|nr:uncharacterized protein COCSADRAFT_35828 [Bipolaris sorokiniana ND90Pr]EMD65846.1 hypothetical protein COCSADRAFT_35828 [Bipolaris sorokiniana ND90Pr]
MYSDFSANPMVADADYSPTDDSFYSQNPFDQADPIGLYTIPPNQSLGIFPAYAYFEQPHPSVEYPAGWDCYLTNYSTQPLDEYGQSCASSFDTVSTFDLDMPSASNTRLYSASPLRSDSITALLSPPRSPPLPLREISKEATSPDEESAPRQARPKRGRPRLDRNLSGAKPVPSTNASSSKQHQRAPRQPHKQVERKYREGLNSNLVRLRRAVPTLSQSEEDAVIGWPAPSKAMILSCAVEYIAKIELERDGLRERNELLGGTMWRN